MKSGFTLIETLIAVIALAVAASITVPLLTKAVGRTGAAEAVINLSVLRRAQVEYFVEHGEFADSFDALGFDPNTPEGNQTPHFSYDPPFVSEDRQAYEITAHLLDDPDKTVAINEAGEITGTLYTTAISGGGRGGCLKGRPCP